jgi:hypothetical protein
MNPNLSRRPAKPALGNGRVQRGALRALWALNGEATTSEVAEWTNVRARAKGRIAGYRIGEDQSGGIGTILQPVFSPMSAMGHFRQIDTLASLAACPL